MTSALAALVPVVVLILIIALVVYAIRAQLKRVKAMAEFALAHGWAPIGTSDQELGAYVPLRISGLGDRHHYAMAYQCMVNARNGVIFEYTYVTETYDADNNRHEDSTSFTVLAFDLPGFMPIEILRHSFLNKLNNIGDKLENLNLEGDFNKHFDVSIPTGQQVEALSLLTPDTMALMIDYGADFSVQIQGDNVVIYGSSKYMNPKKVSTLLDYAVRLEPELAQKLHQLPAPAVPSV